MNKQQLAARIWAIANDMRSKIAANEYKDFILGFMFYKFLSDKELQLLRKEDFTEEEIHNLTEDDKETVDFIKKEIGFFIAYKDLFSTWIEKDDFDVSDVTDALSNFNANIHDNHKNVYDKIFNTLETGLSKLGDTSKTQTSAIKKIIDLIKTIPMDSNSDYDVLGFIYEYLISNFAAHAGKKAGEFYTPHEVSILMSEIIANHLKDSDEIKIYDPTSGSGSLLINIGKSVAKHVKDPKSIIYYAQELKSETYNLTRMNLVMRGISSHNINARNADTLEEDWPLQEDENGVMDPLYLDAVVSNPPYSQKRDPSDKGDDPRYVGYGVAPQGKADYAFLLHDLYHIKPDGIMTIVLPHGVLFRGGEEYKIRKNLVEKNNIDAIIGLPANIFFGTGIPTIIMVLKKRKADDSIHIIDASKYFIKDPNNKNNNKLRESDIKRIVDNILAREDKENFSKVVSKQEIIDNDYNLNIPRYVDSSEPQEKWDIYATMFGGIPKNELDDFNHYFELFPGLKEEIFDKLNDNYYNCKAENIQAIIEDNNNVQQYKTNFEKIFSPFHGILKSELVDKYDSVNTSLAEKELGDHLFNLLDQIKLVDNYQAYQVLSDNRISISGDIEILQKEGLNACRKIDEKKKRKKNKETNKLDEVFDGYKGRIINFEIVKKWLLTDEVNEIENKYEELNNVNGELDEYFINLNEEENLIVGDATNEEGFVKSGVSNFVKNIINKDVNDLEQKLSKIFGSLTDEEKQEYGNTKQTGFKFGEVNKLVKNINKNGAQYEENSFESKMIKASNLNIEIAQVKKAMKEKPLDPKIEYGEDSLEYRMFVVNDLISKKTDIESTIKTLEENLITKIMQTIERLSDDKIFELLEHQRIDPIMDGVKELFELNLNNFSKGLIELVKKYAETLSDLEKDIQKNGKELSEMIDELSGDEFDMKGLEEFKSLLNN